MTLVGSSSTSPDRLHVVTLRNVLATLRQGGPLKLLESIGDEAQGAVTRVDVGYFRPYLITDPRHVQHILRDAVQNYPRDAKMWNAIKHLAGEGIAGEGADWQTSRNILQSAFSGRYIQSITDQIADAIAASIDDLAGRARHGRPVNAGLEMARIVQKVVNLVFFDSQIPAEKGELLGAAISDAFGSFMWRMAMPVIPLAVPMPGDRRFRRASKTVNNILHPLVAEARRRPSGSAGVVAKLLAGRGEDGRQLSDQQVRDDIVALFIAGSESSAVALTWFWVALAQREDLADRVYDEVDQVLAGGPPAAGHERQLVFTQMVLQEVLRVHSVGWAVPRVAVADDTIDGVPIKAGSTVVLSPYLTHRLPSVWDRPLAFDPGRFSPESCKSRNQRYGNFAYFPFGWGAHGCLGEHFFKVEATLIVAALLSRFRVRLRHAETIQTQMALTLRPRRPVMLELNPR